MKQNIPSRNFLRSFLLLSAILGGTLLPGDTISESDSIDLEILAGNFAAAGTMIDRYLLRPEVSVDDAWDRRFQKERMDRIRFDFRETEERALAAIKHYYPEVTPAQLQRWKKEKSLEVMTIDGMERYFHAAVPNLFRIDKDAAVRKHEVDGEPDPGLRNFIREHLRSLRDQAEKTGRPNDLETKAFVMTYVLTVPADTVPEGETLRCWLPYPYRGHRRQGEVELLDSNLDDCLVSPVSFKHSTIYSEKVTVKGQPTVFRARCRFRCSGEYRSLNDEAFKKTVKPYDRTSALYLEHTAQRKEHVVFTPEIQKLSREIVGDETDPVVIVQKIYDWLVENIPWATSREYSTMPNIPGYVIENRHGDCGMFALLFITLCRVNGIPAKWQSGFMLYPGYANLHDWAEVYFEGPGWIPVDASQGSMRLFKEENIGPFYLGGTDSYRLIVNEDYSSRLYPAKIHPRSETVDFQRGEVEWRGGNLYFNQWNWTLNLDVPDEK